MQYLNVALVRVSFEVYEKCHGHLKVGCLVDITGHTQGVRRHIGSGNFVTNELVADHLQLQEIVRG